MNLSSLEQSLYHFMQNSPFDIGFFHPYIVDFAIVVPLLALFFHFIAVLTAGNECSNKGYTGAANLLFFASFILVLLAFLTGIAQDDHMRDLLPKEGQGTYDAHVRLGTYITLEYAFLLFVKIISMIVKKDALRYIVGTLFFFLAMLLIYQDVIGISLVYDYGAGVAIAE
ncbi:MAG TPA: hypothetical protein ENK93_04755 [Campylobacteraceae bacterium]|nr:hypothetical protein [Campylobacteraceae bacterium]